MSEFVTVSIRPVSFTPDRILVQYPDGHCMNLSVPAFIRMTMDAIAPRVPASASPSPFVSVAAAPTSSVPAPASPALSVSPRDSPT